MSTPYTELMNGASFTGGVFSVAIPQDWMQGRTTYGGLSAALCFETAARAFDDLPPLRSALVSFIGPAGGAVEGRAKMLRQGKSVRFIEAEINGEAGLATRAAFAFGAGRESVFAQTFAPTPAMPGPAACPAYIDAPLAPSFASHFETRLARGGRPVSGSSEYDHFIWVRHKDKDAQGLSALLALADMPPPAVMPMFREFAPISSMTWMINFLTAAPQTEDGWWLLQSRAENAAEGYSSQDMLIWNSDRELVVAGRQSVAIFA